MKFTIFAIMGVLVSLSFLLPALQVTGAYYAEPSGYGFYHIWTANLHMAASVTFLGAIAMIFTVRRISRSLF